MGYTYYLCQVGRFWIIYCNKTTWHRSKEISKYEVCRSTNQGIALSIMDQLEA